MYEDRHDLHSCILLIEGDSTLGDTLRSAFEDEGYQVHLTAQAPSVDEVVDIHPDLVMLDIGRNETAAGWQFVQELKAAPRAADLPIVISSGDGAIVSQQDVRVRSEAAAILIKPFSLDDLLPVVATAIARRDLFRAVGELVAEPQECSFSLGSIWY
jgi:DNA-binding response OmpR family regulator